MRFFFYSHDGVGLGHVRRHLAIASALTQMAPEAKVLLATSVEEVTQLGLPPKVETVKLPALRKLSNRHYGSRRLAVPPADIKALRSAILKACVEGFQPKVVVVDKHPFGVEGEFREGLVAATAYGARKILGLRDILDEPAAVEAEWNGEGVQEAIAANYELVLVYGMRELFDPIEHYKFSMPLVARTRFCGYVLGSQPTPGKHGLHPLPCLRTPGQRVVLCTTGGGEDGFAVLRAFIDAAQGAAWAGLGVAGPYLAEPEFQELRACAERNRVTLVRFMPGLHEVFSGLNGLVCMGGYNTVCEAVSAGVPTVCVPRVKPRAEQLLRAEAFQRLGLLSSLHPDLLTPNTLRDQIDAALEKAPARKTGAPRNPWMFDGGRRAAAAILNAARQSPRMPKPHLVDVAV